MNFFIAMIFGFGLLPASWAKCPSYLEDTFELNAIQLSTVGGYFKGRDVEIFSLDFLQQQNMSVELYEDESLGVAEHESRARSLAKKISPIVSKVETVVYPAAGYDSATPFLTFPNARKIVALDDHPFWTQIDSFFPDSFLDRELISSHMLSEGWAIYTELNSLSSLAPKILFHLSHAFPGFRLRHIYEVQDFTQKSHANRKSLSHGVIVFDTGESTEVRSYIHMQTPVILDGFSEDKVWWLESIKSEGFEGLFFKAAMNAQRTFSGVQLGLHIKQSRGVIVDADGVILSDEQASVSKLLTGAKVLQFHRPQFGYAPEVSIIVHD